MTDKVRIALDAMGGDHGPAVVVAGAELALQRHPACEFLFFGNAALIAPLLEARPTAQIRFAARPYRHRGADGGQAEPGVALRPLEIVDVAGDRRGQKGRGGYGGVRRQYRRAHGDVEIQSQDAARNRAAGDCGAVADAARRVDRARRRRFDRRRRRASGRSCGDGRRHRADSVRPAAAERRASQYRRRRGQGPRTGARGRPHPARRGPARSRLPRLCRRRRYRPRQGRRRGHRRLCRQYRAQDRRRNGAPARRISQGRDDQFAERPHRLSFRAVGVPPFARAHGSAPGQWRRVSRPQRHRHQEPRRRRRRRFCGGHRTRPRRGA